MSEHEDDGRSRLALALDVPDLDAAKRLIDRTADHVGVYKVGLELFTAAGPAAVDLVTRSGAACFLDLKLHDIPATMGRSVAQAAAGGARFLTVHAASGKAALGAAAEAAGPLRLLAVTVLTSLDTPALVDIGFSSGPEATAGALARLAWDSGVDGFVSSAQECAALRDQLGRDAFIVTPGIRPTGSDRVDQKRVMTPREAIAAGANLLVVGRPIRDASDPTQAARAIAEEIELAIQR